MVYRTKIKALTFWPLLKITRLNMIGSKDDLEYIGWEVNLLGGNLHEKFLSCYFALKWEALPAKRDDHRGPY